MEIVFQQVANGLSVGMGYALVALGLSLIFGVLHVINFAHGETFMIGGLVTLIVTSLLGVPYLLALPIAGIAGAILGLGINRLAVQPLLQRRDGSADVLLATFAVSILIHQAVVVLWGPAPARIDGLPGAIEIGPVVLTNQRLFVLAIGLAFLLALEWCLKRTRFGTELRAVAQSQFASRVVGIEVDRVNLRTFVIAAVIAAVGGGLLSPVILYSSLMGQVVIIKAFVVVVIGGMGSIVGAVVCGLLIGLLESMLGLVTSEGTATAVIYSLLLAVLLVRPYGLAGKKAR
ncbi:branched-chain amino acid ABC transporter permease [Reyranella sp.]|uniref:branched-chain amino acid ABC transporter permease n=1 Tax=Reyranella sp. TaxID=1929291 RepID=UPI00121A1D46|nr:branched-chain amino acid ABC transporter permease [Reyranella sp.]TAJ82873.1 MAG: branched-chain amino acid ABC transporter permease [Reyranella sp.]